jgi:hypothetical protein
MQNKDFQTSVDKINWGKSSAGVFSWQLKQHITVGLPTKADWQRNQHIKMVLFKIVQAFQNASILPS